MITEAQFSDALSKIFLRFDEMDEKMDRYYRQLRASIDHVSGRLDETNERLTHFQKEQHDFNVKIDERVLRLEKATNLN